MKKIERFTFIVTNRCNSRCSICNIWEMDHNEELKEEVPFEKLKDVFNKSKYLENIEKIVITGGEPFLRSDLLEIIDFFNKKYHCFFSISTNGILSDIVKEFLINLKRLENLPNMVIWVSVDGLREMHDANRGIKCFDDAMKTIDIIKRFEIPAGLSFTISPKNYQEIKRVNELSKMKKVDFGFRFAQISEYFSNDDKKFDWNPKKLRVIKEQTKYLLKDTFGCNSSEDAIEKFDANGYFFSKEIEQTKNPSRDYPCYSGMNSFALSPYGDIYPCIMSFKDMGNIINQSFDEIWDSKERENILAEIDQFKCNCWTECETLPSLNKNFESKDYVEKCISEFRIFLGRTRK